MIEIIYKDEKQEKAGDEGLFSIPRNIRQIGEPDRGFRIYMEDYVYTFLGKISRLVPGRMEEGALAVLTGEICWQEGAACLFIRGALLAGGGDLASDHIDFSEDVWKKLHEEGDRYFPGQEIVGWFFAWPQQPMEASEYLMRTHLKYFGGEKILFLMDCAECEESFFRYENSEMAPVRGYYIYYEKNQPMQEYMLDKKAEIPAETAEKVDDTAVKAFRTIIKGKRKEEEPDGGPDRSSAFSYAAAACLVLAVAAVGTSVYRNYRELQELESEPASSGELTAVMDGAALSPTPTAQTAGSSSILEAINWEETTEAVDSAVSAIIEENAPEATELSAAESSANGTAAGETSSATGAAATETSADGAAANETSADGAAATESSATGAATESSATGAAASETSSAGASSTETSENTAAETSENTAAADAVSAAETSQIYLEESDTRKAKRREAEAAEDDAAQSETGSASAQADTASAENAGTESAEAASSDSAHEMYIIRTGDTLCQISLEHYGTIDAVSEICSLNNLSENDTIYPGQVIVLP